MTKVQYLAAIAMFLSALAVTHSQFESPCPRFFKYHPRRPNEPDKWYGELSVQSDVDLIDGVFIVLVFDKTSIQLGIPKGTFSCKGRTSGYYADVSTGCQLYHMCDGLGRQFSYTCPNATLFQQRMLICDHWYMVNCSKSEEDYSANLLIGQREKPFVEDSETKPYFRTPRPDLLSQPTASEASIIYRNSRTSPSDNIVGAVSPATGDPSYSLPSHWSTEYSKDLTTNAPNRASNYKTSLNFVRTNYNNDETKKSKGKAIDINSSKNRVNEPLENRFKSTNNFNRQKIGVNFNSNFKATTPVYPQTVDVISDSPEDAGLLPPLSEQFRDKQNQLPIVNFQSNFNATTPVYPKSVDIVSDSPDEVGLLPPRSRNEGPKQQEQRIKINFESTAKVTNPLYPKNVDFISDSPEETGQTFKVNFKSNFKATTPVYPKTVDIISDSPEAEGILAPILKASQINQNANFESNFKATIPVYPKTIDVISYSPDAVGILPPRIENKNPSEEQKVNAYFASNFKATTPVYPKNVDAISFSAEEAGLFPPIKKVNTDNPQHIINFASNFKATTPVYAKKVEVSSEDADSAGVLPPLKRNENIESHFKSNFKATTPVYPKYVEPTSQNPEEVGLLAPKSKPGTNNKNSGPSLELEAPLIDAIPSNENKTFSVDKPSKFYQPPLFEPDFNDPQKKIRKPFNFSSMNSAQWSQLRRDYQIPEYDFPLDGATRPSYDSNFSSFMAKTKKK